MNKMSSRGKRQRRGIFHICFNKLLKADLHIHTVLSPCGDLEMSPAFIAARAVEAGLDVIAVTDHNSTRQAPEIRRIGEKLGLMVVCGAEITTREEVHALALVPDEESRLALQDFLDTHLMKVPNNCEVFGYQLVVDGQEQVVYEEQYLLINAIDRSLDQVEQFVHSIRGIFIPAHIDKQANSLLSQLGFVPPSLKADALEISARCDVKKLLDEHPYLEKYALIRSSDSHYPADFGLTHTLLDMDERSFEALREAIAKKPSV